MGQLIIYYDALEDAASQAKKAAKDFDDYADRLRKKVSRKLSDYDGTRTGNISTAESSIDDKISEAEKRADAFYAYASAIGENGFIAKAKSADQTVKSNVADKIGEFRDTYGIKENPIEKWICNLVCKLNDTALGRLLKDIASTIANAIDIALDSVSDWYNYWGGEYLIKDIGKAVLAAVVAVAAVILVVVTGGGALALISAAIAATVACLNLGATIFNSANAYGAMQDGDPSWAKRYSNRDGFTDTLRAESDSKLIHGIALAIDGAEFVGQLLGLADAVKNLPATIKNFSNFAKGVKSTPFSRAKFQSWFKSDMFSAKSIGNALTGDLISNLGDLREVRNVKTVCQVVGSLESTWDNIAFANELVHGEASAKDIIFKTVGTLGSMADTGLKENGFRETYGQSFERDNGNIDKKYSFDMFGDVVGNGDNSFVSNIVSAASDLTDVVIPEINIGDFKISDNESCWDFKDKCAAYFN